MLDYILVGLFFGNCYFLIKCTNMYRKTDEYLEGKSKGIKRLKKEKAE